MGQQRDAIHGIMVKMAMTAKNGVGGNGQGWVAWYAGIGVGDNAVTVRLQQKAGVAQPCELHKNFPLWMK